MGEMRNSTTVQDSEGSVPTVDVLGVIEDERSRAILGQIRARPRTVPELADDLDIPTSTVYRKVDALVDAGLATSSRRLGDGGNHSQQYHCPYEQVVVHIETDGSFQIECLGEEHVTAETDETHSDGRPGDHDQVGSSTGVVE